MKLYLKLAFVMLLVSTSSAFAELKTIGEGADMQAEIGVFPPEMKEAYSLFKVKCSKCHALERTFITLQTGLTPAGGPFGRPAIQVYGEKMLRKPDTGMSKNDVAITNKLLIYMLDLAGN